MISIVSIKPSSSLCDSAIAPQTIGKAQGADVCSFYDEILGYLIRRTKKRDDAEDLTQETMLRFIRWSENQALVNTKRVLFKIAQNLLIDRSRRERTRGCPNVSLDDDTAFTEVSPVRRVEASERLAALAKVVENMPERSREVFVMNRIQGMKHQEIADYLGISKSTVEKHMIRALALCRAALGSE